MARGTKHHNPAAIPSAPARPNHEARHKPLVGGCPLPFLHWLPSQQAPLLGCLEFRERSTKATYCPELRMPLQWKKTTLYPYLTCSRIHVEACTRRLAPLFGHLSDVPVRLLSAVLSSQLGPVQLQRLLSEVLPLRVGLVRAAGAVAVAAAAAAALSPLECLLQWLSGIPVAPCWHLSRKPVVPRHEVHPSVQLQRLRLAVLPLQPVPLLSSVLPLQLGPVPPAVEHVPQLERLLAVVLPLQ